MNLTENAIKVLKKDILRRMKTENLLEDPEGMFRRVARTVASADKSMSQRKSLKV